MTFDFAAHLGFWQLKHGLPCVDQANRVVDLNLLGIIRVQGEESSSRWEGYRPVNHWDSGSEIFYSHNESLTI